MSGELSINNSSKGKLPSLPFLALKDEILSKNYSLSVAYVTPAQSQKLNKKWRKKDKPTNVLSFALSKNSGELILCPAVVKKEAKNFDKNFKEFLGFLVIHGMLHLKGMQHSSRMERAEKKYDQKYFSRNRRGLANHPSGGRRTNKGRTGRRKSS
jgi:probable rRNA maturation factor